MSRAINVNATNAEVSAMCAKHKATISAIEALPSGGIVGIQIEDPRDRHEAYAADDALALSGAAASAAVSPS